VDEVLPQPPPLVHHKMPTPLSRLADDPTVLFVWVFPYPAENKENDEFTFKILQAWQNLLQNKHGSGLQENFFLFPSEKEMTLN